MKSKNIAIQEARGVAALMVFFSHILCMPQIMFVSYLKQTFLHIFFDGQIAVMLFLAISGFFYYNEKKWSFSEYFKGIKRKFLRLYPAFFIAMLISFFLCNNRLTYNPELFNEWGNSFWKLDVSFLELLKQLSIYYPHDTHLINPPTWYIPIEFRLLLFIPIIVMLNNYLLKGYWKLLIFIPLTVLSLSGIGMFYTACLWGYFTHLLIDLFKIDININRSKLWGGYC